MAKKVNKTDETKAPAEDNTTGEEKKTRKPAGPKEYKGLETRIEPNPNSKRGKVYAAGISPDGGSIKAITEGFDCTVSNTRQHLSQINKICGFDMIIDGDTFRFSGAPTVTWEEQKAKKDAEKADKKAKKDAEKTKKDAKKAEKDKGKPPGKETPGPDDSPDFP